MVGDKKYKHYWFYVIAQVFTANGAGVTLQGDLTLVIHIKLKHLFTKALMFGKWWGDLCFHWVF